MMLISGSLPCPASCHWPVLPAATGHCLVPPPAIGLYFLLPQATERFNSYRENFEMSESENENINSHEEIQQKRKFVIESDDED